MKSKTIAFAGVFSLAGAAVVLAQYVVLGPVFPSAVIPYCTVPGYPSTPVAGYKVWYKADTFSPCSATSESSWTDSSGNSNTVTFNTGTFTCNANEVNGHNGLDISGSSKGSFSSAGFSSSANTVFVVFNLPSTTANTNYAFLGSGTLGQLEYRIQTNGSNVAVQGILAEGSSQQATGTITVTTGSWHQGYWNNSVGGANASVLHLDRAVDFSSTLRLIGQSNRLFTNDFNGGENFVGSIAEIIYYDSNLGASDATANECYLYGRYGI